LRRSASRSFHATQGAVEPHTVGAVTSSRCAPHRPRAGLLAADSAEVVRSAEHVLTRLCDRCCRRSARPPRRRIAALLAWTEAARSADCTGLCWTTRRSATRQDLSLEFLSSQFGRITHPIWRTCEYYRSCVCRSWRSTICIKVAFAATDDALCGRCR
jgi:hypothetical protein